MSKFDLFLQISHSALITACAQDRGERTSAGGCEAQFCRQNIFDAKSRVDSYCRLHISAAEIFFTSHYLDLKSQSMTTP